MTISTKRFGRFTISANIIDEEPDRVRKIMGKCIVVRAEYLFHCDCVEYDAISDYFDEIKGGELMPEYDWIFFNGEYKPKRKIKFPRQATPEEIARQ